MSFNPSRKTGLLRVGEFSIASCYRYGPDKRPVETSYPDENCWHREQPQEQQKTICKMAGYNHLLSQRVKAYAGEINCLTALAAKLQHMQVGKSSGKLREKTARPVCEAEERSGVLHPAGGDGRGSKLQHDPAAAAPVFRP